MKGAYEWEKTDFLHGLIVTGQGEMSLNKKTGDTDVMWNLFSQRMVLVQAAQRSCGCPITREAQSQTGWIHGQLHQVDGNFAHGRGVGTR